MQAQMRVYILKRLLLMIPTLLGVLTLTFAVVQFVPGGPVEQMVLELMVMVWLEVLPNS